MRTILTMLAILLLISLGINAWTISQLSTVKKGMKNQQLKVTKLADDIKKLQTGGTRKPSQPDTPKEVLVSFDDDYIKGDPKAPVTIVEFSDYQCPYCRKFHNEILPQIQEEYISKGKVRYIFRDFPLSLEALKAGDRNQKVPAGVADQALDLAFVVALAGPPEAIGEQIVGLQFAEDPGAPARSIAQDAGHWHVDASTRPCQALSD